MPEYQPVTNKITTLDSFSVKNFCISKKSSTFASAIRKNGIQTMQPNCQIINL